MVRGSRGLSVLLPRAVGNTRIRRSLRLAFLLVCGVLGDAAGHGISAEARRRQHVDPGDDAADDFA